jgi:hypothetical protein
MLTIVLIILVIILLAGRSPAWNATDPLGLLVTILLIVLLVALIFDVSGLSRIHP